MARQNVSSGSKFEPVIGFSRAVRTGPLVSVSGTAPMMPDGTVATPGDVAGQTRRCLEIIQKALEDCGASLGDVVRTRVFLTDISQWEASGRAHGEFFGEIRPACTFAEVSGLIHPEWLVEIEADAWVEG